MRAHDHADLILFEELVDDVGTVAHDIVLLLRIADRILLHAKDFVGGSGVAPQNIHTHLLHCVRNVAQSDAQGPLNLVDVLKLDNRVANTAMDAKDAILGQLVSDDSAEWHPLKQVVHLLEDTLRIIYVLIESLCTFLAESEEPVHITIFMIASEEEDLSWVFQLEGKE